MFSMLWIMKFCSRLVTFTFWSLSFCLSFKNNSKKNTIFLTTENTWQDFGQISFTSSVCNFRHWGTDFSTGKMFLAMRSPCEKSGEMVVICKLINKPQNIPTGARPFWKTCNITLHTREGCDWFLQFCTCLIIPWFNINEETGFGDDCFF